MITMHEMMESRGDNKIGELLRDEELDVANKQPEHYEVGVVLSGCG